LKLVIARQHRNSAQELRAFRFDNETPFGLPHAAFLAGRGANEPFAHERTAGCDRIRSLVGALETNTGVEFTGYRHGALEFSRYAPLIDSKQSRTSRPYWIASLRPH
jgi:hypothetical protein